MAVGVCPTAAQVDQHQPLPQLLPPTHLLNHHPLQAIQGPPQRPPPIPVPHPHRLQRPHRNS